MNWFEDWSPELISYAVKVKRRLEFYNCDRHQGKAALDEFKRIVPEEFKNGTLPSETAKKLLATNEFRQFGGLL